MFIKKPQHKEFDFTPRFYNPDSDIEEKRKKRLGFRTKRKFSRKRRNPFYWFVLIVIVVYLYLKFRGYV